MHKIHKIKLHILAREIQTVSSEQSNISYEMEKHSSHDLPFGLFDTEPSTIPDILVVDDSPTVRKIVSVCLQREGYSVHCLENGLVALRWLLEKQSAMPKVLILDIGLPGMDGYELARRIKAKPAFRDMAIVMLSRREGALDRLKGRLAGAKGYLTKPFKTSALVETVQQCLMQPDSPMS